MLDVLMRFLRPSGQYAARDAWEAAQKLSHADSALDQLFPPSMDDEDAYILLVLTALRMRMRGMAPTRVMRVMAAVYDLPTVEVPMEPPTTASSPSTPDTPDPDGTYDDMPNPSIPEGCLCKWHGETMILRHIAYPVHPAETTH